MIMMPWSPALSRDQLEAIANPQFANQPEVVPWALYDTGSFANASAGPLSLFTTMNNDKTLSNMEAAGSLPNPQYFVCYYVAFDFLQIPKATALAGEPNEAMANLANVLYTARATFNINLSNKNYGPFPLTFCHATGGLTGFGYGYGTAANGTSAAAVNAGIPGNGGFPFSGALVIPPLTNFFVSINFATALTIVNGPINGRISLVGNLYRRIL